MICCAQCDDAMRELERKVRRLKAERDQHEKESNAWAEGKANMKRQRDRLMEGIRAAHDALLMGNAERAKAILNAHDDRVGAQPERLGIETPRIPGEGPVWSGALGPGGGNVKEPT